MLSAERNERWLARLSEADKSLLVSLHSRKCRLLVRLEALGTVVNEQGKQLLSDEDVEKLLEQEDAPISSQIIQEVFHLEHAPYHLPQFARRLRNFKSAQGV